MKKMGLFFAVYLFLQIEKQIFATIDLNIAELQYLSDHLTLEECKKLVVAAHFKSYEKPNAADISDIRVPKNIPCFDLLLHWNSAPGEGKGESHSILEHRLRQMGKTNLANWLGTVVFEQIGSDLQETLKNGLKDVVNNESETTENIENLLATKKIDDPTEWLPVDTLLFAVILTLSVIIGSLLLKFCYLKIMRFCKNRKRNVKKYEKLETHYYDSTDTESEEKFDIRKTITYSSSNPSTER